MGNHRGRGTVGRGSMDCMHSMSHRCCMDSMDKTMVGKGGCYYSVVGGMDQMGSMDSMN